MSDQIQITSTSQVRTSTSTLSNDAAYYATLVDELKNAQTQIQANWEGDSSDINDIVQRITNVCGDFENKIIPTLNDLSSAVNLLADNVDNVANSTVEGGSNAISTGDTSTSSGATSTGETASEKKGFWQYHGDNFKNDWDYSGCDSGLDYIGATVDGLVGAVGSTVNFIVDGCSEILGWLFG